MLSSVANMVGLPFYGTGNQNNGGGGLFRAPSGSGSSGSQGTTQRTPSLLGGLPFYGSGGSGGATGLFNNMLNALPTLPSFGSNTGGSSFFSSMMNALPNPFRAGLPIVGSGGNRPGGAQYSFVPLGSMIFRNSPSLG